MSYGEEVVFTFLPVGISGYGVVFGRVEKGFGATGKHFVGIALVRNVIDDFIVGRVKHDMQGNRGLDHAEIGTDVSAVNAELCQQGLSYLLRQLFEL